MPTEKATDAAWFTPRRYGLGVGAPIAWQGWALLGGYLAVVAALVWVPHLSGDKLHGEALRRRGVKLTASEPVRRGRPKKEESNG